MSAFVLSILALVLPALHEGWAATGPADSTGVAPGRVHDGRLAERMEEDVLWLARCIYSESDRPHEQRLVAWVVRNRVETRFRGKTYREVVLEDRQFSVFNEPTPRRAHILRLTADTPNPAWQRAYAIAREVYHSSPSARPFSQTTRHFYSPISMRGRIMPEWAVGATPLDSRSLGVDSHRFRFFDDLDASSATVTSAQMEDGPGDRTVGRRPMTRVARSGEVARPFRPHRPGRTLR